MDPQLRATLARLTALRGFDPARCLAAKLALIHQYFVRSGLTTAVVGVSGGVDSAVVLGLLTRAAREPGSPLRRVVAVLAPYLHTSQGVSNQAIATARGREAALACGAECIELDLSPAHATLKSSLESAVGVPAGPWADGQLVSNLRTPALYQIVTLLTQAGFPGVLFGTTTRDEGSYIGYFGKASDGLCDIQPISDLHKREVYTLARLLAVPDSIVDAAPTGDIWDGRTDHQLLGISFTAVELYTQLLCRDPDERAAMIAEWQQPARAQFAAYAARIEQLHRENAHKYHGSSPALHLDVYERAVPGGWRIDPEPPGPTPGNFVNEVTFASDVSPDPASPALVHHEPLPDLGESAVTLHGLLDPHECTHLLAELARHAWVPVGLDGRHAGFDPATAPIGSWRLTNLNHRFARALWTRIAPHLPAVRITDDNTPTDTDDHPVWRAVGVNPLLRFIRYTPGGALIPHYDSTFIRSPDERTLMSLVLALTGTGETRLLVDPQLEIPRSARHHADWTTPARPEQVLQTIHLPAGSALLLDHRLLHDAPPHIGDHDRIVLRTDIVYRRCGLPPGRVFQARMLGLPDAPREPPP